MLMSPALPFIGFSGLAGALVGGAGCAHGIGAGGARLGVLPVESEAFPSVAAEVSGILREVKPEKTEVFVSKVTMDVAQLSVECIEATSACYSAVGKAMGVNRILFSRVLTSKEPEKQVRVVVTLFDVDAQKTVKAADHSYKSAADAQKRVRKLVTQAVEAGAQANAGNTGVQSAQPGQSNGVEP